MTPAPDRFRIDFSGKRLLGRYVVESKLAEGGMGAVYLARDEGLDGERVVVKVPHGRFLAEEGFRERFDREIRELIKLSHPHVVAILARGEDDGIPYFVLKYLGGGSLRDRLRKQGAQAPGEVARWLPDVARTLDFIHGQDVIHRDVKPANVLFDAHGHVFLSDFGIAKALGSLDTGLTQTGMTPGSPDYMAPESATEASLSPAYDQYALGVVVYEALCGALPHGPPGDTPFKVLLRKAQHDPAPLRDRAPHVPAMAAAAVERALRREPSGRFATCGAFAEAFLAGLQVPSGDAEAATSWPTRASPAPGGTASRVRPRSVPRLAWLALGLVGLGVGALWGTGVLSGPGGGRKVPGTLLSREAAAPPPTVGEREVPGTLLPGDATPPTLVVEPAGPEVEVGESGRVTLRGRAADAHLAAVLVDGERVVGLGSDGTFTHEVSVSEGETRTLRIEAVDGSGNVSVAEVRRLWRAAAPPPSPPPPSPPPPPPPEPSWRVPLVQAMEAGRAQRWGEAQRLYDEAVGLEAPSGEVPEWLRAGVTQWRAAAGVTLVSPSSPHATREGTVRVRALLTTGRGTDTLWIGGTQVREGPGEGSREVALVEGSNEVVVEARDETGTVRATARLAVTREAKPAAPPKPSWARTSASQDADASSRGIPVWREVELGGGEALRFVWIPPGTFTMGSPSTEVGRDSDEVSHEVELTQGFYLSVHEVTNGQYRRFQPGHDSGDYQGSSLKGAAQPVVMVSHEGAQAYVEWLDGRGAERYRLPTEAEWEYACRAGTRTSRWWGEGAEGARGRESVLGPATKRKFGFGAEAFPFDDGHDVTSPVGSFTPNGWGLYDMHGNVWEWCSDWYGPYPTGRVKDPRGPSGGGARVLRGGSWHDGPRSVRSAGRSRITPDVRYSFVGFRVVLLAPRSASAGSDPP